jgi:pimeloyl-ACP methyl ester carboxylesterase
MLRLRRALLAVFAIVTSGAEATAQTRDPVTTDPVIRDRAFPPSTQELSFRSGDARLNGFIYLAQGKEPHPTIVLLHGYPGNERNLDLAQAMRRAGMNVLYFNYRGSWGSGGDFSFANAQQDVAAAVLWLRSPEITTKYHIDARRIALVGHSMGGWLALLGAAADSSIACVGGLEFADMARRMAGTLADTAKLPARVKYDDWLTEPGAPLHADARSLEKSLEENATRWDLTTHASELAGHTLLLLDNDKNTDHAALVAALAEAGAKHVTTYVWPTDHTFSDRRIALARSVVGWLRRSCGY